MTRLPLYFHCHYFKATDPDAIYEYKIDSSSIQQHPYQLFRRTETEWQNLSVYASITDAVMILLKELFTCELADEVSHGQATINPADVMMRIDRGDTIISIHKSSNNRTFKSGTDVNFERLVERTVV